MDIKDKAKELCNESGCHHKCNDTKDCVVEDEAMEYLPSTLKNEEKISEIEEMAKVLCKHHNTEKCKKCGEHPYCSVPLYAEALYKAGYRKQKQEEKTYD